LWPAEQNLAVFAHSVLFLIFPVAEEWTGKVLVFDFMLNDLGVIVPDMLLNGQFGYSLELKIEYSI